MRRQLVSVNLRLEPEMHEELVRIAKEEERSLAGQVKLYLKQAIEERRRREQEQADGR